MREKFKVNQVWSDRRGNIDQTIVAITDNVYSPIITQAEDGTTWSYRKDGTWPIQAGRDPHQYDLVTLVKDVEDFATEAA